jgi:hypothetical protein
MKHNHHSVHIRALNAIVMLASLLMTKSASAAEDDEPSVDVSLHGGYLTSTAVFAPAGYLAGINGHYRISPNIRVGAGVDVSDVVSTSSDHGNYYSLYRFLSRIELHARPKAVIDPFVGATLGLFHVTPGITYRAHKRPGSVGLDAGLDAGVDFHIGKHFAIGPVMSVVVPLSNKKAFFSDSFWGGTYYSGPFGGPWPFLRLQAAF